MTPALANLLRDTGQTALPRQVYEKARNNAEDLIKTRPASAPDRFDLRESSSRSRYSTLNPKFGIK